jgi:ferredoxin
MGPAVYPLDDEGRNALTELEVPAELEDQARLGADACPERAISIVD